VRRARAAAQLLGDGPARTPQEIVGHLLAVQAQDLRAARLALRARSPGLDPGAVDAALADGSLVIAWLMRGTLHLVRREDWAWLLALAAPTRMANSRRRLTELGVDPATADRAVDVVGGALAAAGEPLTRAELAERLAARGIPVEGQATPHLLGLAGLRGALVACGHHRYAFPPEAGPALERDEALAELARRYLAAHAPADDADLASWSGLPLRDARRGLALSKEPRVSRSRGSGPPSSTLGAPGGGGAPGAAPPRLLPAFDPYLLGWKDRSFAVPDEQTRAVHPGGGILRATAIDDGVAVGTWTLRGGRVGLEGFAGGLGDRFASEVADVERFASGGAPSGPRGTLRR
jgi:Winged helix DNA-binding domain